MTDSDNLVRLIAIDAGNTSVAIGIFENESLVTTFRVASNQDRFEDEWTVYIDGLLRSSGVNPDSLTAAAISSTVPQLQDKFKNICESHFNVPLLVIDPAVPMGLEIKYQDASEIGPDRILHAVAALEVYEPPIVIVDLGTACVLDAIDAEGAYVGGAIAPGIGLASNALFDKAAMLRTVKLDAPETAIGNTTAHALQSGICLGYGELVDGMVGKFKSELGGSVTTIGTGGYIDLVRSAVHSFDVIEEDLNLKGLRILNERMSGENRG